MGQISAGAAAQPADVPKPFFVSRLAEYGGAFVKLHLLLGLGTGAIICIHRSDRESHAVTIKIVVGNHVMTQVMAILGACQDSCQAKSNCLYWETYGDREHNPDQPREAGVDASAAIGKDRG